MTLDRAWGLGCGMSMEKLRGDIQQQAVRRDGPVGVSIVLASDM